MSVERSGYLLEPLLGVGVLEIGVIFDQALLQLGVLGDGLCEAGCIRTLIDREQPVGLLVFEVEIE